MSGTVGQASEYPSAKKINENLFEYSGITKLACHSCLFNLILKQKKTPHYFCVIFYSGERLMDFSESWTKIWMENFLSLSFLVKNPTLRGYSEQWTRTTTGLCPSRFVSMQVFISESFCLESLCLVSLHLSRSVSEHGCV